MKCNNVSFSHRGDSLLGRALANLLGDITVHYTTGNVAVSTDLGSLLQTLDEKVLTKPEKSADPKQAVSQTPPTDYAHYYQWLRDRGFDPHHISDNGGRDNLTMALAKAFPTKPAYTVQTEVPVIAVPERMAWFLQSRNIPLDTPVTLTFVHDVRGPGR